jgi:hypothetical protein
MKSTRNLNLIAYGVFSLAALGCNKGGSFSVLAEKEQFSQAAITYNNKVDIVWMVDGSGTMANHQRNLADNFGSFISEFASKGFDYNMVVASTDAWVREVNYNGGSCWANPNPSMSPDTPYVSSADCRSTVAKYGELAQFRDGDIYGSITGVPGVRSGNYLLTSVMPLSQIMNLFRTNVRTGTRGDGTREGAFQSLRAVLRRNEDGSRGYGGETHTDLERFRRPDAFLSVIIVSDEEDQSRKQDGSLYTSNEEYVNRFRGFLDGYTGYAEGQRWYSVNSIVVDNIDNCPYELHNQASQGDRYVALAQATAGVVGNICSPDFSSKLSEIARKVVTLLTRFKIAREPIPSTISVVVDGRVVPESNIDGWTYTIDSGSHYINFHGSAVPPQGASINIKYDPTSIR